MQINGTNWERTMTLQAIWWIAAIVLVIAELFTGSLYLLAVALGALAGGIAAWTGTEIWVQAIVCSLVTLAGIALVRRKRASGPPPPPDRENPDLILDVGNKVFVEKWDANGSARVSHRGTDWNAQFGSSETADDLPSGWYVIKAIDNNSLILVKGT
jgi:membrane protein implicated in regulation of membrane protease activity